MKKHFQNCSFPSRGGNSFRVSFARVPLNDCLAGFTFDFTTPDESAVTSIQTFLSLRRWILSRSTETRSPRDRTIPSCTLSLAFPWCHARYPVCNSWATDWRRQVPYPVSARAASAFPGDGATHRDLDDISTEFSYFFLSVSPTSRNVGRARQQVRTPHDPEIPWHLHFIFMSEDKTWNDEYT